MTHKIIRTEQAPAPIGPYNQGIAAQGQMIFLSGQIPLDPVTNQIVGENNITVQIEQVMKNIEAILSEAGAGWSDIVKTTIFLKNMEDFATVNGIYARFFPPETAPARSCVEVARLPKDVLVEIECIAMI